MNRHFEKGVIDKNVPEIIPKTRFKLEISTNQRKAGIEPATSYAQIVYNFGLAVESAEEKKPVLSARKGH